MVALTAAAVIGGLTLAIVGFWGSYEALRQLAEQKGFGFFSVAFPIGLDAGIVACLALDLYLIRKGAPLPLLRLLAHLLTAATVAFNGSKSWPDPLGVGMHAIIPILFVASVEAARKLVIQAADLEAGRDPSDGIPGARWLLAPVATWCLWRRMRLYRITSYAQIVAMEQDRTVYEVLLKRQHGKRQAAPADAQLPFKLARYGLSVEEALGRPAILEEAERRRKDAETEALEEAAAQRKERAADREERIIRAEGRIPAVQAETKGQEEIARTRAQAGQRAAEREAEAQERAAEQELEAARSEEAAAALRRAAEEREAAAEADARAVEAEARAAEGRELTAGMDARAAEVRAHAAADQQRAAEAQAATAEAERTAEAARSERARLELEAIEREDIAKLNPTERDARQVARHALHLETNPETFSLKTVATLLGVSESTASLRRTEAAELVDGGYRG